MSETETNNNMHYMVLKEKEPQVVLDWYQWLHGDK
jgi:hypothetical protein